MPLLPWDRAARPLAPSTCPFPPAISRSVTAWPISSPLRSRCASAATRLVFFRRGRRGSIPIRWSQNFSLSPRRRNRPASRYGRRSRKTPPRHSESAHRRCPQRQALCACAGNDDRPLTRSSPRPRVICPSCQRAAALGSCACSQIKSISPSIPSRSRGVSRSSRTLERDAVDAAAAQDERADPPSLKLRRDGTKTAGWLLWRRFADGEVVWS